MHLTLAIRAITVAAAVVVVWPPAAYPQGNLTPPGAPAATMKSLSQIEPRIDVLTLTGDANNKYIINQPGSYYLTASFTVPSGLTAIAITVDNVTLNLNGFAILGSGGASPAIQLQGARNEIVIRDGTIQGFATGSIVTTGTVANTRIERMQIANSGINLPNGYNITVRDSFFGGVGAPGAILLSPTSSAGLVEGCTVDSCTGSAVTYAAIQAHTVLRTQVTRMATSATSTCMAISATLVDDCGVSTMSNSSGATSTNAISASSVNHCTVNDLTISGAVQAIVANTVNDCAVINVTSGSGTSGIGINAPTVRSCRVQNVNINGGSLGIGIAGNSVQNCSVSNVGGPGNTVSSSGINGGSVTGCYVSSIGQSGTAVGAFGIQSSVVSSCYVSNVTGGSAGSVYGIVATEVDHCHLGNISLTSGSGTCFGINAETVSDCRIASVTSGGSGMVGAITSYKLARNCTATTFSGSGSKIGYLTTLAGRSENLTVIGPLDIGISVGSNQIVAGCTVSSATTGIFAAGTGNVIDANSVTGPGTTGISVTNAGTAQALVTRNVVRNFTTNKILADSPAQVGQIVSGGGTLTTATPPMANYTD